MQVSIAGVESVSTETTKWPAQFFGLEQRDGIRQYWPSAGVTDDTEGSSDEMGFLADMGVLGARYRVHNTE